MDEADDRSPLLGRKRSREWTRVAHGLYQPASTEGTLHAWQLLLAPSGVFTHLTAAEQYGWWLPPLPDDLPVFTSQLRSEGHPQRPGLRVFRHPRRIPFVERDGLRLATPAEVLLACARQLCLLDLVVLVDAALQLGPCTLEEIEVVSGTRRMGAPRLRQAVALADGRSESPWETLLRVLHVVCGVQVEPQFDVHDRDGCFLGRADLLVVGTNALHEYDGGDHLERRQQRKDLRRGRGLGNSEWLRRGYTDDDVLHRAVSILRDADLSLGRSHEPARVRAWHAMVAESLFTPAGQTRLRRTLKLPDVEGGGRRPA